jgi:hypothetical protein
MHPYLLFLRAQSPFYSAQFYPIQHYCNFLLLYSILFYRSLTYSTLL